MLKNVADIHVLRRANRDGGSRTKCAPSPHSLAEGRENHRCSERVLVGSSWPDPYKRHSRVISLRRPTWQHEIHSGRARRRKSSIPRPRCSFFLSSRSSSTVGRGMCFSSSSCWERFRWFLNTSADLIVILLAGPLGKKLRSSEVFRRRQRTATGFIMIGLGTYLATGESE
jgi:hypothetical protein